MGVTFSGSVNDKKLNYFEHELERLSKEEIVAKERLAARVNRHGRLMGYLSFVLVSINLALVTFFAQRFSPSQRKRYRDWDRLEAGLYLLGSTLACCLLQEMLRAIIRISQQHSKRQLDAASKKRKDIILALKEMTKVDRVQSLLRKFDDAAPPAPAPQLPAPTPGRKGAKKGGPSAPSAPQEHSGLRTLVDRAADVLVGSDQSMVEASLARIAAENAELRSKLQACEEALQRHGLPVPGAPEEERQSGSEEAPVTDDRLLEETTGGIDESEEIRKDTEGEESAEFAQVQRRKGKAQLQGGGNSAAKAESPAPSDSAVKPKDKAGSEGAGGSKKSK